VNYSTATIQISSRY